MWLKVLGGRAPSLIVIRFSAVTFSVKGIVTLLVLHGEEGGRRRGRRGWMICRYPLKLSLPYRIVSSRILGSKLSFPGRNGSVIMEKGLESVEQ